MMDATPASSGWPTAEMARELATELRAKEREILDFNGLPEVTRFRELAQHASGQPFQQGIAILIPFHDPTGKVKNGGGAFSALGFAFVSETAAAAVSQKRTQTETWEDGESTSWTAADARSCCVHELIHLTQTSPSVEDIRAGHHPPAPGVEFFVWEGITEWLTCKELTLDKPCVYSRESRCVDRLFAYVNDPHAVAQACCAAGGEHAVAVLAAAVGTSETKLRSIFEAATKLPGEHVGVTRGEQGQVRPNEERKRALFDELARQRKPDFERCLFSDTDVPSLFAS